MKATLRPKAITLINAQRAAVSMMSKGHIVA